MTMFDLRRTTWTAEDAKILAGVISDDLRRNLLGWDAQDKETLLAYLRSVARKCHTVKAEQELVEQCVQGSVVDTDNRDPVTTTIRIALQDGQDVRNLENKTLEVNVDPVELFFHMVDNLPEEDYDTSDMQGWIDRLTEELNRRSGW